MKNRLNGIVAIAAGMILLLSGSLSAQQKDGADREARKEAMKELRERYSEWAHAEIVPKLTEWKRRLDEGMAPEDLEVLNDLRAEAKELRKRIRQNVAGLRKAWREEDYEALKQYRADLSEARRRRIDIIDLLTPLAIEYRETLKEIGEDAKSQARLWKKEGREIWEEWRTQYGEEAGKRAERMLKKRAFFGGLLDPQGARGMRAIRFMLWDGGDDVDEKADTDEPGLE